jgi:hypothetical protein
MNKQLISIIFFLFFILVLNWTTDKKTVFYFLVLVLIGVLLTRIDDLEELIS